MIRKIKGVIRNCKSMTDRQYKREGKQFINLYKITLYDVVFTWRPMVG